MVVSTVLIVKVDFWVYYEAERGRWKRPIFAAGMYRRRPFGLYGVLTARKGGTIEVVLYEINTDVPI